MELPGPLYEGILLRRYKRFLADVELANGDRTVIHCPNTGSMKNCQAPGSRVWFTLSDNPRRKYPGTWQIVEVQGTHLVGINTGLANALVAEAIAANRIAALAGYEVVRREVPYGVERGSRIDLLLQGENRPDCYVEIKNVSLGETDGIGLFPDAVTRRGQKHLLELIREKEAGNRALQFFCVQHSGIREIRPADAIDPDYGRLLREAKAAGVEVIAFQSDFDLAGAGIELVRELEVNLETGD